LDLNEEREEHLKSSSIEFHIIEPWKQILNIPCDIGNVSSKYRGKRINIEYSENV